MVGVKCSSWIIIKAIYIAIGVAIFSCATAPKVSENQSFQAESDHESEIVLIPYESNQLFTAYKSTDGKSETIESITCKLTSTGPGDKSTKISSSTIVARGKTVLTVSRFGAGFSAASFCRGWIAQSFLSKGFDVLGVNRPGSGASTGTEDLGGMGSVHALEQAVADRKAVIDGIWGVDVGATTASFFAKKLSKSGSPIKWMILGEGIYDFEIVGKQTSLQSLKEKLGVLVNNEGDLFFERRSIAWDFSGVPTTVGIYHRKDNTIAPVSQAEGFINQLRTSEFKVFRLDIEPNPMASEIPWQSHRKIVMQLLDQVAPQSASSK